MKYAMVMPWQVSEILNSYPLPKVNFNRVVWNKNRDFLTDAEKRLLIGATVKWEDSDPLSLEDDIAIHYWFETGTNAIADLALKRAGLLEASQFASISFQWYIEMVNHYTMPNRASEKPHTEKHAFNYTGKVYPVGEKIKRERDAFFMDKNLQFAMAPNDNKNKKVYEKTVFTAYVVGAVK
jgi:alanine dehydrogenase